jgi:hypothetical protein
MPGSEICSAVIKARAVVEGREVARFRGKAREETDLIGRKMSHSRAMPVRARSISRADEREMRHGHVDASKWHQGSIGEKLS